MAYTYSNCDCGAAPRAASLEEEHHDESTGNTWCFTLLAALAILTPRAGTAQATSYQVIRSFRGDPDGAQPMGAVVIGKDGALYGTTELGGTSKTGTVFKLAPCYGNLLEGNRASQFHGAPRRLIPP